MNEWDVERAFYYGGGIAVGLFASNPWYVSLTGGAIGVPLMLAIIAFRRWLERRKDALVAHLRRGAL